MPFDVSFSLVDGYARRGTKRFEGEATTLAQSEIDEAALWTDFATVSDMGRSMTTYSVSAAETDAATAGANVDAGATLSVRLDDGMLYALKIPAIKPALINPDGSVDITNAAITNFVANFETGGAFKLGRGRVVVALLGGQLDR